MPSKKHAITPTPKEKRTGVHWERLNAVIDPELGVGIVDLGLVYAAQIKKGRATITMTLTSMGCPAGPEIIQRIEEEMEKVPKVAEVVVNLVWEPLWGPDLVDPEIRDMIFGGTISEQEFHS